MDNKKIKANELHIGKVAATFLVVLAHSSYTSVLTRNGSLKFTYPDNIASIHNLSFFSNWTDFGTFVAVFVIEFFFMVSGAVYAFKEYNSYETLVIKKFKTLMIPLFLYSVFYMFPIKYLLGFYDKKGLIGVMDMFMTGADSGHLWFLNTLFWVFVLFYPIQKISKLIFKKNLIFRCISIIIISVGIFALFRFYPGDLYGAKRALSFLIYFSIGYALNLIKTNYKIKLNLPLTAIVSVVLSAMVALNELYAIIPSKYTTSLVYSLALYMVCYLLYLLFANSVKFSKVIIWLSGVSMSVYLLHDPLNYLVLKIAFSTNLITTNAGYLLYFFFRIFGIIIISILLNYLIQFTKKSVIKLINNKKKA